VRYMHTFYFSFGHLYYRNNHIRQSLTYDWPTHCDFIFFPNLSIFVGVVTVEDGVHNLSMFNDLMQGMKCSSH
jgi:hypothetical protein